jgi:peptide/nickel transport system substrate-binding protein
MRRPVSLAVVAALVALLALSAAAPSQSAPAAQPKRGGTLTVGINADAATLNPFVFRFNVERNVLHATHETLVNYNLQTFELANTGALESWQVSRDGLSYTLRLWANLKFHDGSAATAEDLKWSLEKAAQPTSGRTFALLTLVDRVDVVDPRTVRVTMKSPDGIFTDTLVDVWLAKKDTPDAELATRPNGTGPFKLTRWDRAQGFTLERNPDYHAQGKPYLDRVALRIIPDDTVRQLQMFNNQLDLIDIFPVASVAQFKMNRDLQVYEVRGDKAVALVYFALSNANPPFNDKRVRVAASLAIDRAKIKTLLFGLHDARGTAIPRTNSFYATGVADYSRRNLDRAKQLLAESGNSSPEFDLQYHTGFAEDIIAQAVEQSLKEAGFRVNLRPVEIGQYVASVLTPPFRFQGGLTWIVPKPNPYDQINHPYGKINGQAIQFARQNQGFYDRLQAARGIADPARFKAAIQDLQKTIAEDQPAIIVGGKVFMHASYKYVRGFTIHPQQRLFFTDVWLDK